MLECERNCEINLVNHCCLFLIMDLQTMFEYNKMCRACMNTKDDDMISLSPIQAKMFAACTEVIITPDDPLPKKICLNCSNIISDMVTFKEQCLSSDAVLRKLLQSQQEMSLNMEDIKPEVKFEPCDDMPNEDPVASDDKKYDDNFIYTLKMCTNDTAYDDSALDDNYLPDEDDIPLMSINKARKKPLLTDDIFKKRRSRMLKHKSKRKKHKIKLITKETIGMFSNNTSIYDCGICKSEFPTFDSLASHLEIHKNETICKICDEHCTDWPQLLTHSQEHVNRKTFICYICKSRITSILAIEFHIRVKHLGEKGIKCKICERNFTTLRYLKKHMVVHSDTKPFSCSRCPKRFKTSQLLKTHQRTHENEKKYVCDECGFSCNFPTGLRCHIERRHNSGLYSCKSCSKQFTNKETLSDHVRSHKQHYVCSECGKSYNRVGMARHIRMHSNERPFACDKCPARFRASATLANHRRRHTGERPYKCKVCSSAFHTQNVLIKHVRIHTGEKPYVCRVCGKAFTGGHNLKVHMKVHGENLIIKKKQPTSDDEIN